MKPIAILHEGNARPTHDNHLLGLLIQHLNLDIEQVDFYGMGYKSNFFKTDFVAYHVLKSRIADNQIKKILFIVDADYAENDGKYGGFTNTQAGLDNIIDQLDIASISQTHIVCDPLTKSGYLESFILSTIPEAEKNCIEQFLDCSQFRSKENHKAILNQIYKTAYPNAPYNFAHAHFEPLKAALTRLYA